MSIITPDQFVKADVSLMSDGLDIDFGADPSYTLSERVIIDLMRRNIGVIFQNTYHDLGPMPDGIASERASSIQYARLHGHGEHGRPIELHAPITFLGSASKGRKYDA